MILKDFIARSAADEHLDGGVLERAADRHPRERGVRADVQGVKRKTHSTDIVVPRQRQVRRGRYVTKPTPNFLHASINKGCSEGDQVDAV